MTFVSIALATCNGERYLERQLDSLLAQTYRPIEIVVCDDFSDDSTVEILTRYASSNPGVFKIQRNDARLGYVRNFEKAMGLCSGDYIAPCDQDDVWRPDKIRMLVDHIGGCSLIHSDARMVDETGMLLSPSFTAFAKKDIEETGFLSFLRNNVVTGCTCMIKSGLLEKAIPFWRGMPHDQWLALMAADDRGIAYIPEPLIDYRQHSGNTSGKVQARSNRGLRSKAIKDFFDERRRTYDSIVENYGVVLRFAEARLSPKAKRDFSRWLEYYKSFSGKRVRLRAFIFHATHLRLFSRNLSGAKALMDLALSLIGDPALGRNERV